MLRGSSPRLYQFRLPGQGRYEDAELVVFRGIGGSAVENVTRWRGIMAPPTLEPPRGVPTTAAGFALAGAASGFSAAEAGGPPAVREMKIAGFPATYVDFRGTYVKKSRPFDPSDRGVRLPNYRMLAVHFEGPRDVYHLRLIGPDATVERYKQAFDAWLGTFE